MYSLGSIRELSHDDAYIYLETNHSAFYGQQVHPLGDIRMSQQYAEQLLPLLQSQDWCKGAEIWKGQEVDYNLDKFRDSGFPLDRGNMADYYKHIFGGCPKTWEPTLDVDPDPAFKNIILVNRTQRYLNNPDYSFLREFKERVVFIGLPIEHFLFCHQYGLTVPIYTAPDFLAAARAIAGCRMLLGNQSCMFAIAEQLKTPRILETCMRSPNVCPCGPNGYQVITQPLLEKTVRDLV